MRAYFQYDEEDDNEDVVVVSVETFGDEADFLSVDFDNHVQDEEQPIDEYGSNLEADSAPTVEIVENARSKVMEGSDHFDYDSGIGEITLC